MRQSLPDIKASILVQLSKELIAQSNRLLKRSARSIAESDLLSLLDPPHPTKKKHAKTPPL